MLEIETGTQALPSEQMTSSRVMEPQESSAVSLLKESKKGSGLVIWNMAWPPGWDHTLRTTVLPAGRPVLGAGGMEC